MAPPRVDPRREEDSVNPPPNVQEMFEFLSEQMHEIAVSVRAGRTETAELRSEVMPHIRRLNRRVFGPRPPPFPPPEDESAALGELAIRPAPSAPPLASAVVAQGTTIATQHDTIELLQQEVSNLRDEVIEVKAMNAQQSRAMGLAQPAAALAKRTRAYMTSRAGVRDLVFLLVAISGLIGVWRGGVAPAPPPLPALSSPVVPR